MRFLLKCVFDPNYLISLFAEKGGVEAVLELDRSYQIATIPKTLLKKLVFEDLVTLLENFLSLKLVVIRAEKVFAMSSRPVHTISLVHTMNIDFCIISTSLSLKKLIRVKSISQLTSAIERIMK